MFKVTVAIIIKKKIVIVKNKNLQYQVKKRELFCVLTVIIFD